MCRVSYVRGRGGRFQYQGDGGGERGHTIVGLLLIMCARACARGDGGGGHALSCMAVVCKSVGEGRGYPRCLILEGFVAAMRLCR